MRIATFSGKFERKIDQAGRISFPFKMRRIVDSGDYSSEEDDFVEPVNFHLLNIKQRPASEYIPKAKVKEIFDTRNGYKDDSELLDNLDLFSRIHEASFNYEKSRFILPKEVREHIGADDAVLFIGMGYSFQIWNANAYNILFNQEKEIAQKF